ncbi:MAG: HD domain-containing protein [Vicinamibacteraceae bacterium]|nr:HD domain-containing protein [Vicinamibacteraceae bacterium]MCL4846205.1 HD domain-containing protein [Acidobacteriota bacterium]
MTASLLRSRVARRILVMFVLSVLAPLCLIALISLRDVRGQLREQAVRHLEQELKSWSLAAVARLQYVESHLRAAATLTEAGGPYEAVAALFDRLDGNDAAVLAVTVIDHAGRQRSVSGLPFALEASDTRRLHLERGGIAGSLDPAGVVAEIATVHGRVAVLVNDAWLWALDNRDTVRDETAVTVLDERGRILATSLAVPPDFGPRLTAALLARGVGHDTWRQGEQNFIVAYRTLPLETPYHLPPITVVFTRAADEVLAASTAFSRSLLLTLLATLWLVVLLSLRLIRSSLQPLDRLRQATIRLERGDFSTRVDVRSGDEFEELAGSFNAMANGLETQFRELEAMHLGTLNAFARAIDAKSSWTAGHSERVTELAVRIGQELNLPAARLSCLRRGGLLHDIGKLAIPGAVLDKLGPLTPGELALMQEHPMRGVRILEPIAPFADLLPIVGQHHERFDGGGYPLGLRGDEIDVSARVLAVADAFDAMTSNRPYRCGLDIDAAVRVIRGEAGRQFDPLVVEAFLRVLARGEKSEAA